MTEKMEKEVSDLGVCAYLMMHGFEIGTVTNDSFIFDVYETDELEFIKKEVEYLKSEFHRFDSYIMALKKMRASKLRRKT